MTVWDVSLPGGWFQDRRYEHPQEGLQVSAVIASDERDLVVSVQVADLGDEFLYLAGFLHADAVGQFGQHAVVDGVHTDEFGGVGVFDKGVVEESVEWHSVGDLYAQDLACHFAGEPVEAGHDEDHQADDHSSRNGKDVKLGANRHADCHREEDEADVTSFFDGVPEADDG